MATTSKYWTTIYVEFKSKPLRNKELKETILAGIMRLCNINRKITHTDIVEIGMITKTDKILKKSKRSKIDKSEVEKKYREEHRVWGLKTPPCKG